MKNIVKTALVLSVMALSLSAFAQTGGTGQALKVEVANASSANATVHLLTSNGDLKGLPSRIIEGGSWTSFYNVSDSAPKTVPVSVIYQAYQNSKSNLCEFTFTLQADQLLVVPTPLSHGVKCKAQSAGAYNTILTIRDKT